MSFDPQDFERPDDAVRALESRVRDPKGQLLIALMEHMEGNTPIQITAGGYVTTCFVKSVLTQPNLTVELVASGEPKKLFP